MGPSFDLPESAVVAIACAVTLSPTLLVVFLWLRQERSHRLNRDAIRRASESGADWVLIWRAPDHLRALYVRSNSLDGIADQIGEVGDLNSAEYSTPKAGGGSERSMCR